MPPPFLVQRNRHHESALVPDAVVRYETDPPVGITLLLKGQTATGARSDVTAAPAHEITDPRRTFRPKILLFDDGGAAGNDQQFRTIQGARPYHGGIDKHQIEFR